MKGLLILLTVFGLFIQNARAQDHEVTQLLLNVEKLAQFREIYSNMLKGYNIVSGGYAGIRDISQGNFGLHRAFMTGLEQVNPSVAGYRKVGETVKMHSVILLEGRKMIRSYYDTGLSRPQELEYFQKIYSNIFNLSLRNLDELLTIVASGALVMSDEE
ncbi:MAG TPA: hypothetical protein VK921_03995, partial [Anditalea sp.]|nr:hypothetical protein [Anditalea sp.]